ncbi:MAG TPA: response regulator [Rhodanobacteraceae bacterium]
MNADASGLAGCRVLVVEDEARIAALIGDTLEDIGCEVVATATRFDDALDKATSLSFDVAVLDVDLNGRPSYPIAEALDERGRAFVFATGYGAAHLPSSLHGAPVLQKPFGRRDLERVLLEVLC